MKIYVVKRLTINSSEPYHYATYSQEEIVGVYDSNEKALELVDKLFEANVLFQEEYPEMSFLSETVTIEEFKLNNSL